MSKIVYLVLGLVSMLCFASCAETREKGSIISSPLTSAGTNIKYQPVGGFTTYPANIKIQPAVDQPMYYPAQPVYQYPLYNPINPYGGYYTGGISYPQFYGQMF